MDSLAGGRTRGFPYIECVFPKRTLARRDAGLDELVDRESAFLAELEDRQLLVGEVLRTSGDTEVGDGFQGGVQEKVKWGLFRSVKDYSIQNIV